MVRPKIGRAWKYEVAKHHLIFFFRNGGDGRNGTESTPQTIVATVASSDLYSITSTIGASITM